jgi:hypothetical protein
VRPTLPDGAGFGKPLDPPSLRQFVPGIPLFRLIILEIYRLRVLRATARSPLPPPSAAD